MALHIIFIQSHQFLSLTGHQVTPADPDYPSILPLDGATRPGVTVPPLCCICPLLCGIASLGAWHPWPYSTEHYCYYYRQAGVRVVAMESNTGVKGNVLSLVQVQVTNTDLKGSRNDWCF